MNKQIRLSILTKFDSQADFAQVLNIDESIISRVLRGRRKLSKHDVEKWIKVLKCDPKILEPVTQRKKQGFQKSNILNCQYLD